MDAFDQEMAAFEAAGEAEIGKSAETSVSEDQTTAKTKTETAKAPEKVEELSSTEGAKQDEYEFETPKPEDQQAKEEKSAKDHQIERLKREKAELKAELKAKSDEATNKRIADLEARLKAAEKSDTETSKVTAPDPGDLERYPLGHLDPRYGEDMLEWKLEQRFQQQNQSDLQRQQEQQRERAASEQQKALLDKVDALSLKGKEQFEDFQEHVIDRGFSGEWLLAQPTFEATSEADHGPQILHELASNPAEAARVAGLSAYGQLKYVRERDEAISKAAAPRRVPQAGEPPQHTTRGANSRIAIDPATDNLSDFERAWEADARRGR